MNKSWNSSPRLPSRLRCAKCQTFKSLIAFAVKDTAELQRKIQEGYRIDPSQSGLVCRDHSLRPRKMFECERCGVSKDIDDFSGRSRKLDEYICKTCVTWLEDQEPGVVPLPEINATVSPDEADLGLRLRTAELEDGFFEDIDTEADEELKPALNRANVGSLAAGLRALELQHRPVGTVSTSCSSSQLPPHLAGLTTATNSITTASSISVPGSSLLSGSKENTAPDKIPKFETTKPKLNAWAAHGRKPDLPLTRGTSSTTASIFEGNAKSDVEWPAMGQSNWTEVSVRPKTKRL